MKIPEGYLKVKVEGGDRPLSALGLGSDHVEYRPDGKCH